MRLTTFSDYTMRVLIYLALNPDRLATINEIAESFDISESHLMKVVHQLGKQNLIESVRGKGGGIRLARPPSGIRLGEVLRASEGDSAVVECLSGNASGCRIAPACRLANILATTMNDFYLALDRFTLADLVHNGSTLTALLSPMTSIADTH